MNARELFGHWEEVRQDLLRGLERFTEEELNYHPTEAYDRSVADIAVHIASAEDGWINYVVRGKYDEWPAYTTADYPSWQSITDLLKRMHEKTLTWLETVDESDLDETIAVPWDGELTLRWIIWHVLEHEIHHRGELFLCLGLLGRDAPDI